MITASPDLLETESSILNLLSVSLDHLTDACVWLTKEGEIQGYNSAFQTLVCGNHPSQLSSLIQLSFSDCLDLSKNGEPIAPQDDPGYQIKLGHYHPIDYELKRGEEELFLRISGTVFDLNQQEIIILWIQNITPLKQLEIEFQKKEQSLRQTEAVLRATLEATADGILVVGQDCDIPVYNQKFLEIWSMPQELMQPNRNQERVRFAAEKTLDPVGFINRVKNFSQEHSQEPILDVIELKDGRVFQRYGQLQWQGDRMMGRVFSFRDITQQKKIEKSLRESEERLRTLINAMPDIICFKDGEGRWLESNQANLKFLGLEDIQYQGKTDIELARLNPSYREHLLHCKTTDEQAWSKADIYRIEEKVLNSDGNLTIFDMIKVPLFETDGKRKGLVVLGRNITQRKQAEEALKAREAQYRDLVETANCVILRWDTQGNIKFINNYGKNFFGFSLEEIIGKNVVGTIVPETETSGRDLKVLMDEICQHPENYILNENENICKQGQRVWVVWSNKPIFNEQGELIEILSVGTDATERRQAQDALKHSLSLQKATFESIQEGVLAVDNQANIITYNRHFVEMWSVDPELFKEPSHAKRIQYLANQVKNSEDFFQKVKELYAQPERDSYDLLELKDGRVFERYSCPQRLGKNIIGRVWCFRDITDQKQAEADLKASEEKFRRIVETAHDVIYLMNAEGILLYIAPNVLTLTGYLPDELEGQVFTLYIHPEERSKSLKIFQTLITTGERQFDIEFRVKHKDGTWNWYSSNWSVSQNAQGNQLIVGVSRNINERRRLENEFISLVSHELRTPLTSLVGGLDLLASGQLGLLTEQGKKLLNIAINNTERLIRLVNNILDLERMKSGKISVQKVQCNLADLMIQAQEAMQPMADQAQIQFEVNPFDYSLWVDPDRIIQILTNLLSNAIKFSEPKRKVWMSADVINLEENNFQIPYICLQVKDQGRGIPKDKLQIIFERFEQVDASDSRTKGGTGLGLAICRLMVEQHQGKIWAESCLGEGSIFYVMLPLDSTNSRV